MIEIPLSGGAANAHQIQFVQLGGNFLELQINYITTSEEWAINVLNEGVMLMAGVALKPNCEISLAYRAGVGRFVMVGDEPTLDNLGKSNKLVYVDE
jgi:hypothetical protein